MYSKLSITIVVCLLACAPCRAAEGDSNIKHYYALMEKAVERPDDNPQATVAQFVAKTYPNSTALQPFNELLGQHADQLRQKSTFSYSYTTPSQAEKSNYEALRPTNTFTTTLWHYIAASGWVAGAKALVGTVPQSRSFLATRDTFDLTPLHLAGSWDMAEWLLQQPEVKANNEIWLDEQYTPLHHAASQNRCGVMQALFNYMGTKGILPAALSNQQDRQGNTPLHYALQNHRPHGLYAQAAAAQLLVKRKANISTKNNEGMAPTDLAAQWGSAKQQTGDYGRLSRILEPYKFTVVRRDPTPPLLPDVVENQDDRTQASITTTTTATAPVKNHSMWQWFHVPRCVTGWNIWQKARSLFSWCW